MKWTNPQKWLRLPETLAHRLESYSPELAKRVLNYASQVVQPELLATLFNLEEWSDIRVGVTVPLSGATAGNLVTLSEFMARTLMGRHLPLQNSDAFSVQKVIAQLDTPFHQAVKLRLELKAADREAWLNDVFRDGQAFRELVVRIWSAREQRLGEIQLEVRLHHTPALPGATGNGSL
ncbi:MAG: hypothetical protein AB7N80_01585 [Bdellovibrionales bacterium]